MFLAFGCVAARAQFSNIDLTTLTTNTSYSVARLSITNTALPLTNAWYEAINTNNIIKGDPLPVAFGKLNWNFSWLSNFLSTNIFSGGGGGGGIALFNGVGSNTALNATVSLISSNVVFSRSGLLSSNLQPFLAVSNAGTTSANGIYVTSLNPTWPTPLVNTIYTNTSNPLLCLFVDHVDFSWTLFYGEIGYKTNLYWFTNMPQYPSYASTYNSSTNAYGVAQGLAPFPTLTVYPPTSTASTATNWMTITNGLTVIGNMNFPNLNGLTIGNLPFISQQQLSTYSQLWITNSTSSSVNGIYNQVTTNFAAYTSTTLMFTNQSGSGAGLYLPSSTFATYLLCGNWMNPAGAPDYISSYFLGYYNAIGSTVTNQPIVSPYYPGMFQAVGITTNFTTGGHTMYWTNGLLMNFQ